MHFLYLTPAFARNGLYRTDRHFRKETILRFLSLLLSALLGSLAVNFWLDSLTPETPIVPPTAAQITTPIKQTKNDMLPTLESLEGLFIPSETVPQASRPRKGMSPLEIKINEELLESLDPYILTHSQTQVFVSNIPTGSPLSTTLINSPFGFRIHPTLHGTRLHAGVDLKAAMNTQVMATADGVVEFTGTDTNKTYSQNGFGQTIVMQHNYG
ncbi:MAG: M23 family metallopeptidase, partial [Magnetococcales bacterium]|nr:M23 family metallopeptidase [Magnetococcales bacterium]